MFKFNDKTELELAIFLVGVLIICVVIAVLAMPTTTTSTSTTSDKTLVELNPANGRIYPDKELTPGDTNPEITQGNVFDTICSGGKWSTKQIRPPVGYTNALKRKQIEEYGYADKDPRHYEEDHMIPLTLGGHPTDPHNLWPEAWYTTPNAHDKDSVEVYLWKKVCKRELTLEEAQKAINDDWVAVWNQAKKEGFVSPWEKHRRKGLTIQ